MLGEGQHIIIVILDREFGGAIEGFFEAVKNGDFFPDVIEEIADVRYVNIEEEGAAVGAADAGQLIAEAFEGLEHEGDLAVGDHCPDGLTFVLAGDGHRERESEDLVKGECRADVADEEVGGEGFHILIFAAIY